jgi:hypothetical protein
MNKVYAAITTVMTLGVLLLIGATRFVGLFSHQLLALVLGVGVIWGLGSRALWWWSGRLHGRLGRNDRRQLLQAVGRGTFWFVLGLTTLAIFPHTSDMTGILVVIALMWLLRLALELMQPTHVHWGPTAVMGLAGLGLAVELVYAFLPTAAPILRMAVPFEGEWYVLQGGHSPLQSHHLSAYNQEFAIDVVKLVDGTLFDASSTDINAMMWCWDQPLYAPVSGTVVAIRDDIEDSEGANFVAEVEEAAGNHVVLQAGESQYVVFAHLKQGTIAVAEGQEVAAGDFLGRVGNSGNTTLSHLHLQVQTHPDLWHPDNRSLPFAFGEGPVLRRNDRIVGRPLAGD